MQEMTKLEQHKSIQGIAKSVLSQLKQHITPSSTEASIARFAIQALKALGISETWYHNTPALVLLGSRSCLSLSGRDYQPAKETVGDFNLVTVDLSPSKNGVWGDCARSFFVENGAVVNTPQHPAFSAGQLAAQNLHTTMRNFVTPDTRLCDLFEFGQAKIKSLGFENLDFNGNLGHSIPTQLSDRLFVDGSTTDKLESVKFFTFEPHIRQQNGQWGFKHEEIYFFDSEGQLHCL